MDVDLAAGVNTGVRQRFRQRFVRFGEVDILADHRDVHRVFRVLQRRDEAVPRRQVRRRRVEHELLADDRVEALGVQRRRNLVDRIGVGRRDDGLRGHVGEQRDLAPVAVLQRPVDAAQDDVGLNADLAQLLDRVLRRLGLHLARGGDVRHEREMDVADVFAAERDAHLPDCFEKRQRLDVADRAADFDHGDLGIAGAIDDPRLDFVGDVRDHLHGAAEVVAASLLADHALVDLAGREVVALAHLHVDKALVVAEIEVGLGAVLGDEHLAVLERTHRSRIDVDVRVELEIGDADVAGGQYCGQRRGGDALPQRGDDAAGHEDELGHGRQVPEICILPDDARLANDLADSSATNPLGIGAHVATVLRRPATPAARARRRGRAPPRAPATPARRRSPASAVFRTRGRAAASSPAAASPHGARQRP